jgi:hypothetical protein
VGFSLYLKVCVSCHDMVCSKVVDDGGGLSGMDSNLKVLAKHF